MLPPPGGGLTTVTPTVVPVAMSEAGIATVRTVLLTNVVVRALPFHRTDAPETKLEPLIVSVKAGPPAVAEAGSNVLITGVGLSTWNVVLALPPPGAGFTTVTVLEPAVAMAAAGIDAVTWLAFTKVVGCEVPANCTKVELLKFVPLTVNTKAEPPVNVVCGLIELRLGMGFSTLNDWLAVPPPGPGFETNTRNVPIVVRSLAGITARTWLLLSKKVVRAPVPFQRTPEVETKLVPVTVMVNWAEPTSTLAGESSVTLGLGLLTAKGNPLDSPPPPELKTVTVKVPPRATSDARICAVS